jgi:hypothetical protein
MTGPRIGSLCSGYGGLESGIAKHFLALIETRAAEDDEGTT